MPLPFAISALKNSILKKKNLKLSKSQVSELQQKKFKELVNYAYNNSGYYKNLIDERKISLENPQLSDFPVINKNTILENFNDFVTDQEITLEKIQEYLSRPLQDKSLFLGKYTAVNTSGSSGTVGYYLYSQTELADGISYSTIANGLKLQQRYAFIGATQGRFAGISMINSAKRLPIIYQDVLTLDINSPLQDIIDQLNKFQPTVLSGYASILPILAKAQQDGKLKISPQIIDTSAEPLTEVGSQLVASVFKVPIINVYACSEHLIIGIGKEEYEGMYLMEDNFIFEFKEKTTLITNLYNKTMPMIRYEMNDVLKPKKDDQNLLPYTLLDNILAREEYIPYFKNSKGQQDYLHPIPLIGIFVENLHRYQFVIENDEKFTVRVIYSENISKAEKEKALQDLTKQLNQILEEKNFQNVKFEVEEVNNLPVDKKTGKFKIIVKA
jgi:phenylacetate-CoA ligase